MNLERNDCTALGDYPAPKWRLALVWYVPVLCVLSLLSVGIRAELPSLYGENFIRTGEPTGDVRLPLQLQLSAQPGLEQSYRSQLTDLESSDGPYANKLAQPLLGLGRYYARNGDYEQALDLFRRALHIVRLNDGLYSTQQAPFVRALLDTTRLTGDMNTLDDRYNYFFRLYGSGGEPYTDLRVRATAEYLRWQREALRLGLDSTEKKRLLRLYQLNDRLLVDAIAGGSSLLELQWSLARSQILNLYLVQSIVHPRQTMTGPDAGSIFSTVAAQSGEIDFEQKRLEAIQSSAIGRGALILERYINAVEAADEVESIQLMARAALELADWYQWNGSRARANEHYAKLIGLLVAAGEEDLMHAWFDEPVELPDNGAFLQPPQGKEEAERSVVVAIFDVTARGKVKNLSVEGVVRGQRFKREFKKMRFRPRYTSNREPAYTRQLEREYELYD